MDLTLVLGSAAVLLSLLVLWWSVAGRRATEPVNLGQVGVQADLRARSLVPSASERAVGPLHRLGEWLHGLLPGDRTAAIARRIRSAGSPDGWSVERVLAAKFLLAVIVGFLLLVRFLGAPNALNLLLLVCVTLLGFFFPNVVLESKVNHRRDAVRMEVAEVIDQLAVMVRAGLSIDAALVRSAQANQGAMGEELRRVVQDMRVGVSRATALTHMADRVDIPELRGFVAALSQADQLGVPVTETLRVQADEMRLKQRQAAEEMAMKLPVKILFPTVLCILPVIFIVLLGPAALRIFDQFGG